MTLQRTIISCSFLAYDLRLAVCHSRGSVRGVSTIFETSESISFHQVKSKKQQVRYEDTGIALANSNDFTAGLQVRHLPFAAESTQDSSYLFAETLDNPSANIPNSIFLCPCTHQESDDNDDDDDDIMNFNEFDDYDEEELLQMGYFSLIMRRSIAMEAAQALSRITQQRGEARYLLVLSHSVEIQYHDKTNIISCYVLKNSSI